MIWAIWLQLIVIIVLCAAPIDSSDDWEEN